MAWASSGCAVSYCDRLASLTCVDVFVLLSLVCVDVWFGCNGGMGNGFSCCARRLRRGTVPPPSSGSMVLHLGKRDTRSDALG